MCPSSVLPSAHIGRDGMLGRNHCCRIFIPLSGQHLLHQEGSEDDGPAPRGWRMAVCSGWASNLRPKRTRSPSHLSLSRGGQRDERGTRFSDRAADQTAVYDPGFRCWVAGSGAKMEAHEVAWQLPSSVLLKAQRDPSHWAPASELEKAEIECESRCRQQCMSPHPHLAW